MKASKKILFLKIIISIILIPLNLKAGKQFTQVNFSYIISPLDKPQEPINLISSDDHEINAFLNDQEETKKDRWGQQCAAGNYIEVLEEHYKINNSNNPYDIEYAATWRNAMIEKYALLPLIWCELTFYKNKKKTTLEENRRTLKYWIKGFARILIDQAACTINNLNIEHLIILWKKRFLYWFDPYNYNPTLFCELINEVVHEYEAILTIDKEKYTQEPNAPTYESILPHPELILLLQSPQKKYKLDPRSWHMPSLFMIDTIANVSHHFPCTLKELTCARQASLPQVTSVLTHMSTELFNLVTRRCSPIKSRIFSFY